jgi:Rubisco LSMT substrate-binding
VLQEVRALRALARLAALALGTFPTTVEEDEQALSVGQAADDMKTAIRFRLGKKRALLSALRLLGDRITVRTCRHIPTMACQDDGREA